MIESINQAGGAGGGVQSVVAGTGISVDNTDPENPIVNSAGIDTDEKAKVSANDTTAGYLNGKLVAGSGIGFTENNNGGNETLTVAVSNLNAGAITTGTIATARLGTGTANSSTYLAGDQTYKAAVTSVNGATGAVTVAATSHTHAASDITSGVIATARLGSGTADATTYLRGDQTWATIAAADTAYSLTVLDAENTNAIRNIISFTVPANTWANGEFIYVQWTYELANFTAGLSQLTNSVAINGTQAQSWAEQIPQGDVYRNTSTYWLYRDGSNIRSSSLSGQNSYSMGSWQSYGPDSTYWNINAATATAATFTSDITIALRVQWISANASLYKRIMNARAWKPTGQAT